MTMRKPVVVAGSVCLLILSGLACQVTSQIDNLHTLSGLAYWVSVTETAVPTVTVFLGTTTAVYPPTPVPAQQATSNLRSVSPADCQHPNRRKIFGGPTRC